MTVTGPEVQCWGCRLQEGLRKGKTGNVRGDQRKEVKAILEDMYKAGFDTAEASIHAERKARRNGTETWEQAEQRRIQDEENGKRRARGLGPSYWAKVRACKRESMDLIDSAMDPNAASVWAQKIGDGSSGPGEGSSAPPGYWYSRR
jgi:hypothetical protein